MKEVEISVDIFGTWKKQPPGYRIYINEEMLCEHSFYAMEYEFYRDTMLVELESGKDYTFRFEQLPPSSAENRVVYTNLLLDGNPVTTTFSV